MKVNFKKIGWVTLKIIAILMINCVSIFFIISKIIPFNVEIVGKEGSKILTINLIDYWKWVEVWKWYYSLLMYFGMGVGFWLTFHLLKLFHTQKREKIRVEKDDKFKKDITKILGGRG